MATGAERLIHAPDGWRAQLPTTRGKWRFDASLAPTNWFRVGGPADALFRPEDVQDLADFMAARPHDVPLTILGVGSNVIIRDGGLDGIVIRLGGGFNAHEVQGDVIELGAGLLCAQAAQLACEAGLSELEFLVGIPGNIGGALAMNAGAYGREIADVLVEVEGVDGQGNIRRLPPSAFAYSYRHATMEKDWIFTRAWLRGTPNANRAEVSAKMEEINAQRAQTQPIRSRTGGSTFKNPEGKKAWQLVDEAGCRGLTIGGAQMSELHCNFMINTGEATAADLENLGEEVRARVKAQCGVQLEWEIKRIGRKAKEIA